MCGVMMTERVNQTPASAQDPFAWRLAIRVSTIALKLGSLAVEVRSQIFESRVVFFG